MDLICPRVYIGDLTSANDSDLLKKSNVGYIISLGCTIINENIYQDNNINKSEDCIHFPNVLDTPEACFIDILMITNAFLSNKLEGSKHSVSDTKTRNVLVHCVYGQSRSAVVILWYLVTEIMKSRQQNSVDADVIGSKRKSGRIGCRFSATELMCVMRSAFETLYSCHPCICINPGFISQLQLCLFATYGCKGASECGASSSEYLLCLRQSIKDRPESLSQISALISSRAISKPVSLVEPVPKLAPSNQEQKQQPGGCRIYCRGCGQVLFLARTDTGTSDGNSSGPNVAVSGMGLQVNGCCSVKTPLTGVLYGFERDQDPFTHFSYMDPAPGSKASTSTTASGVSGAFSGNKAESNASNSKSNNKSNATSNGGRVAVKPTVASNGGVPVNDSITWSSVPYIHDFWRNYYTNQTQPAIPLPLASMSVSGPLDAGTTIFQQVSNSAGRGNPEAPENVFKDNQKQQSQQKQRRKTKEKQNQKRDVVITANNSNGVLTVVVPSDASHAVLTNAVASFTKKSGESFLFCHQCGTCCGVMVPKGLYVCNNYVLVDYVAFYVENTLTRPMIQ